MNVIVGFALAPCGPRRPARTAAHCSKPGSEATDTLRTCQSDTSLHAKTTFQRLDEMEPAAMVCGGFGSLDWAPFSSHSWDADRFSSLGSLPGRFLGAILDRRGVSASRIPGGPVEHRVFVLRRGPLVRRRPVQAPPAGHDHRLQASDTISRDQLSEGRH